MATLNRLANQHPFAFRNRRTEEIPVPFLMLVYIVS
jgi:hypothetical protein